MGWKRVLRGVEEGIEGVEEGIRRSYRTTRVTSQAVERRPGQMLERHDLAKDSTREANLEIA